MDKKHDQWDVLADRILNAETWSKMRKPDKIQYLAGNFRRIDKQARDTIQDALRTLLDVPSNNDLNRLEDDRWPSESV